MPHSGIVFDEAVCQFIDKHHFQKYLDIGCGAGKYGKIIRQFNKNASIIGIEVCSDYIKQFALHSIYDELYKLDALDFCKKNLTFTTELVIIGDCIEHLWKSAGIDLINFLVYRCRYMLLIFPTELVQFNEQGQESENHISVWSAHDFVNFDYQHQKIGCMNLVILKGYL